MLKILLFLRNTFWLCKQKSASVQQWYPTGSTVWREREGRVKVIQVKGFGNGWIAGWLNETAWLCVFFDFGRGKRNEPIVPWRAGRQRRQRLLAHTPCVDECRQPPQAGRCVRITTTTTTTAEKKSEPAGGASLCCLHACHVYPNDCKCKQSDAESRQETGVYARVCECVYVYVCCVRVPQHPQNCD